MTTSISDRTRAYYVGLVCFLACLFIVPSLVWRHVLDDYNSARFSDTENHWLPDHIRKNHSSIRTSAIAFWAETTIFNTTPALDRVDVDQFPSIMDAFLVKDCLILLGPAVSTDFGNAPAAEAMELTIRLETMVLRNVQVNYTFNSKPSGESAFGGHSCVPVLSQFDEAEVLISYRFNDGNVVTRERRVKRVERRGDGACEFAATTIVTTNQVGILAGWLTYSVRRLGVCHFYLYFHGNFSQLFSLDAMQQVQPFIDSRQVSFVEWDYPKKSRIHKRSGVGDNDLAQMVAQKSAYQRYAHMHKAMLFIDMDEYVVLEHNWTLDVLLQPAYSNGLWVQFGSVWSSVDPPPSLGNSGLAADWFWQDPPITIHTDNETLYYRGKQLALPPSHPSRARIVCIHISGKHKEVPRSEGYFLHFANLGDIRNPWHIKGRQESSMKGPTMMARDLVPRA